MNNDDNGKVKEEQPGKKVLKQAAVILISKEGDVVVNSKLVNDAPGFLAEILSKATLGIIQRLNKGVKKSIIQKANVVPGSMLNFARKLKRF